MDGTLVHASRKLQISQFSRGICGGTSPLGRSIFPVSHWLLLATLASSANQLEKKQHSFTLHDQQDRAMHKLVTGIK